MKELYFCIFSDFHYWPGNYPTPVEGLETILADADRHGVQLIAHCGDFAHNAPGMPEVVSLYKNNPYGIPTLSCIGNHETEASDSFDAVLTAYGMRNNYEYYDFMSFRLIVLDTNYYPDESGALRHNPPHSHSAPRKPGDQLPPDQLAWLRETVLSSPYPCLLFSHASFEEDCGCVQAASVRALIREANAAHPGRVLMCLNGHYHRNAIASHEGVVYMDVNAAYNNHWQWEKHDAYPPEFAARARLMRNICLTEDPLHAFVRVREDGTIDVEGMESAYHSARTARTNSAENASRVSPPSIRTRCGGLDSAGRAGLRS